MKLRINYFLFASLLLCGCSDSNRALPLVKEPWVISGVVTSDETKKPLPGKIIVLQRVQPGPWICGGCLASHPAFLFTKSDASGNFYFSSTVPGYFAITAECSTGLGLPVFEHLDEITSGAHTVHLEYRESSCSVVR